MSDNAAKIRTEAEKVNLRAREFREQNAVHAYAVLRAVATLMAAHALVLEKLEQIEEKLDNES